MRIQNNQLEFHCQKYCFKNFYAVWYDFDHPHIIVFNKYTWVPVMELRNHIKPRVMCALPNLCWSHQTGLNINEEWNGKKIKLRTLFA